MRYHTPRIQDFVQALGKIPAFYTLPLALVSYLGCHYLATLPIVVRKGASANDLGNALAMTILKGAAMAGQFLLPIILVMGALAWAIKWNEARKIQNLANSVTDTDTLANLSWQDFEAVVGHGFSNYGFQVQLTQAGADGGVDLVMNKDGNLFLVQCKHYLKRTVSVDVVRALHGSMVHFGADAAYVVTSGRFTRDAEDYVQGKSIWLYNGDKLKALLTKGRDIASDSGRLVLDRTIMTKTPNTPSCPVCGAATALQLAKQGPRSGKRFYGCTNWPDCKGAINADK